MADPGELSEGHEVVRWTSHHNKLQARPRAAAQRDWCRVRILRIGSNTVRYHAVHWTKVWSALCSSRANVAPRHQKKRLLDHYVVSARRMEPSSAERKQLWHIPSSISCWLNYVLTDSPGRIAFTGRTIRFVWFAEPLMSTIAARCGERGDWASHRTERSSMAS